MPTSTVHLGPGPHGETLETGIPRPDLVALSKAEKRRVLGHISDEHWCCGSCGHGDFNVGHGLYLGFLSRTEPQDAYMIALTCSNEECGAPHTGLTMRAGEFR
ncbi:MAG: hypothetical protein ACRDVP_02445 [Acidimicrobiales bacterium]